MSLWNARPQSIKVYKWSTEQTTEYFLILHEGVDSNEEERVSYQGQLLKRNGGQWAEDKYK